ncbi:hypothetical protein [Aquimarina litoralis]|uniref:hypothetical protein n=1 Tax=Aquimarina litoralis TaxID=584605 RepID=UPI001C575CB3|nr:hypothetical protein [Aquimarina litoralis]MBW1297936.1 hypothetical protein [Aquimarina litoralis]
MKSNHITYVLFLMILMFGFTINSPITKKNQEIEITPLDSRKEYTAGEEIVLKFKTNTSESLDLSIESSYGSTFLVPDRQGDHIAFIIPEYLARKRGLVEYNLIRNQRKIYSGKFQINSSNNVKEPLESYLGPPSIIAGGIDYAMLSIIATDQYDNPVKDSTMTVVKHQFLDKEIENELYSRDFIVWKNIYSYEKSGRILVSANINEIASKEFTLDVFPSQAEDFELFANKKHEYADGNQIVEFFTSTIRDEFGNIISDGRVVEFSILKDNQEQLRTSGTTIDGVARGFMIHPDQKAIWDAKAFIPEMAESNSIELEFKPAVTDYNVTFKEQNRTIEVGAIVSFMNQIIPDGAFITLHIYQDDRLIEKLTEYSSKGFVNFHLSEDFFPKGIYTMEIIGMGVYKKYDRIELE